MSTLPSGTRRYTPNSHSKTVRLNSPEAGEEHIGYFRVPEDAVTFKEHSNDVLRYDRVVVEKIKQWMEWKARLGLVMTSKPRVFIPTPSPTPYTGADPVDDGDMRCYVSATFRRSTPAFMPLDVFLDRKDSAERYGVDIEAKRLASNPLSTPVAALVADADRNPMEAAERRRAGLGLKRELLVEDGVAVGAEVHA